jgi:hypothetical protein
MSKAIIGMLVVIVIVGGYLVLKPNKPSEVEVASKSEKTEEQVQVKNTNTKKIAFSEFVKQGGSYKCTVNQHVGGTDTKGTTYISNGMLKGEYATEVNDAKISSTFVVRDGYTYSWSSMMPSIGFKSKVIAQEGIKPEVSTSGTYSFNAEQMGSLSQSVQPLL